MKRKLLKDFYFSLLQLKMQILLQAKPSSVAVLVNQSKYSRLKGFRA